MCKVSNGKLPNYKVSKIKLLYHTSPELIKVDLDKQWVADACGESMCLPLTEKHYNITLPAFVTGKQLKLNSGGGG